MCIYLRIVLRSEGSAAASVREEVWRQEAAVGELLEMSHHRHTTAAITASYTTKSLRQQYYASRQSQVWCLH